MRGKMRRKATGNRLQATGRSRLLRPAIAGVLLARIPALASAETCYRDNDGRMVKRRRPGYVEVECPPPGEKPQPNAAPGTVRESPDAGPGSPTPFTQREPAKVSPVPRP